MSRWTTRRLACVATLLSVCRARVFDRCELAQHMRSHGIQEQDLPDWLCLAYQESRYNTAVVRRLNWDGPVDHGLFQISDLHWCDWSGTEPHRNYNNICGASCDDFRDEDIADDLACVMKIHQEQEKLQGNGFMAWVAWRDHCHGAAMASYGAGDCRWTSSAAQPPAVHHHEHAATLMPDGMTNGHARHRSRQAVALARTRAHSRARLSPYVKSSSGWKPPVSSGRRRVVKWSPQELRSMGRAASGRSRRPAATARWSGRRVPPTSGRQKSQSRDTSAGGASSRPEASVGGPAKTSAAQFRSNVFLGSNRRPTALGTTTASGVNQRQQTKSARRRARPVEANPPTYPYQANTFLRSIGGGPPPRPTQSPKYPFTSNVFLQRRIPTVRPANRFPGNVFLSSIIQGSKNDGQLNPFGANIFLAPRSSVIAQAATTSPTAVFQLSLPPVRNSFDHNAFLSSNTPKPPAVGVPQEPTTRRPRVRRPTKVRPVTPRHTARPPPIHRLSANRGPNKHPRRKYQTISRASTTSTNHKTSTNMDMRYTSTTANPKPTTPARRLSSTETRTVAKRPAAARPPVVDEHRTTKQAFKSRTSAPFPSFLIPPSKPRATTTQRPAQTATTKSYWEKYYAARTTSGVTKTPRLWTSTSRRPPTTHPTTPRPPTTRRRPTTRRPPTTHRTTPRPPTTRRRPTTRRPPATHPTTPRPPTTRRRPTTHRPRTTRRSPNARRPPTTPHRHTKHPTTGLTSATRLPTTKHPSLKHPAVTPHTTTTPRSLIRRPTTRRFLTPRRPSSPHQLSTTHRSKAVVGSVSRRPAQRAGRHSAPTLLPRTRPRATSAARKDPSSETRAAAGQESNGTRASARSTTSKSSPQIFSFSFTG